MHELTWLYIFMLALEAEKLGKFDQAERLERLALITAYKAGFVDSLICKFQNYLSHKFQNYLSHSAIEPVPKRQTGWHSDK